MDRNVVDDPASLRLAQLTSQASKQFPRLFVRSRTLRRSLRIPSAQSRIGRHEQTELLLADESVSENHAELRFDGKGWRVFDSGSRNGTFVDGEPATADGKAIARNTVLHFGAVQALFLVDDPTRLATDLRHEARALRHLLRVGKLTKDEGKHVLDRSRSEALCIAEIVLKDTATEVAAWIEALTATANPSALDRVMDVFRGVPRPSRPQ
jgi:hypothetical protein